MNGAAFNKKKQYIACSLNLILGEAYFMRKCQIPEFLFDPLWTRLFRGAVAPQGDPR